MAGQAGAGKSRLALEFLNQLPTSWFGFFASDKATEKDIEEFKPFAHTVMVIDYVADQALGMSWGARQDAKYNPIMGSGIDEIDRARRKHYVVCWQHTNRKNHIEESIEK